MDAILPPEDRYSRHLALPDFSEASQEKLAKAKVLVVGAGGLGCPVLSYLSAAGVGTIGIADPDIVSLSNLQRQILYKESDIGLPKAERAAFYLQQLNSSIEYKVILNAITRENVLEILPEYDMVVDGTDNFPSRYLLNDACVLLNKIYIYGSIFRFEGQVAVFNAPDENNVRGPNYRDLFPEPPPPDQVPNCAEGGVLGVLPGIIGSIQASEVLKIICDLGEVLAGKVWIFDAASMINRTLKIKKNPTVQITQLINYEAFCGLETASAREEWSVPQLKTWLDAGNDLCLVDVRTKAEYSTGHLPSINIPLDQLGESLEEHIDFSGPLVFYCRSGNRSQQALQIARNLGREKDVFHLKGGLLAYGLQTD